MNKIGRGNNRLNSIFIIIITLSLLIPGSYAIYNMTDESSIKTTLFDRSTHTTNNVTIKDSGRDSIFTSVDTITPYNISSSPLTITATVVFVPSVG